MSDKIKVALVKDEWYPVMTPHLELVGSEYFGDHEIEIPRDLLKRYEQADAAFDLIQKELFTYYDQTAEGQNEAKTYGR